MKKRVFVTGAGRGIGQTMAIRLAKEGYAVSGCARSADELKKTEDLSSGKIRTSVVDVTDFKNVETWISEESSRDDAVPWGLVAAAGVYGPIGPFVSNSWEKWLEGISITLHGAVFAAKVFASLMIERKLAGRIVLMSGGGATQPLPNLTNYCAGKAAVVRFGETLAYELAPSQITVNSIAPGAVNTKFLEDLLAAGADKVGPELYDKALKQKESGGTSPEKAADLAVYLMSDKSQKITGKLISAVWDPWSTLHEQSELKSETYTLRRITPPNPQVSS